ncbi:MAG: ribulokinase [Bacteroidota bacterium]
MTGEPLVLGLDYGTDSVRALVVEASTGRELASEVALYRRWAAGEFCDPAANQFRQHPKDYLEGLEEAVRGALAKLPPGTGDRIAGIGIDTTGSTPCAVDANGVPLALLDEFATNPNAMFVLWKDHTAVREAEEINRAARTWGGTDFTKYEGGIYSTEWFWAKILHVLRADSRVREAAFSWVEHCDWLPAVLTGTENPLTMKRSRCAAGHKAMWHEEWNGLPPEDFLAGLDPLLAGLRARLYRETQTSDVKAGGLTREWADRLGLREGIAVAVGAFDAHMGAVGGGVRRGALVKIMGTSTCDVMVAPYEEVAGKLIRGICGQVDGSVLPGMIGLEAGQSAYGDVYAWLRRILLWPFEALLPEFAWLNGADADRLKREAEAAILRRLTAEAEQLDGTGLIALDWLNGRRTPDADQTLKGAIAGLTLGTTPAKIFRALVEATAFGAKAIVDRFTGEGVAIGEIIAMGGIAKKNPFVMQVLADVLQMPIKVVQSEQACALGAAIFGAVAAGLYDSATEAQARMASPYSEVYDPDPANAANYQELYRKYAAMGEMLGETLRGL